MPNFKANLLLPAPLPTRCFIVPKRWKCYSALSLWVIHLENQIQDTMGVGREKEKRERETGFDLPRRLQSKLQEAIDLRLARLWRAVRFTDAEELVTVKCEESLWAGDRGGRGPGVPCAYESSRQHPAAS